MDSTARRRTAELLTATDGLFAAESYRLATLALPCAIPTVSSILEFAAAGGPPSYGVSVIDGFRLLGVYTGRILKGEKPSDLPIQQSTKIGLAINLKTAKALGLMVTGRIARSRRRGDRVTFLQCMSREMAHRDS
jgi:putative tryptophan/tyrosine transport system substrate-binding protein